VYSPTPLSFALPAMINPVVCDSVYFGVSHPDLLLSLEVFAELGYKDAMVVTSSEDETYFLDELSPLRYNYFGRIDNHVIGKKNRLFAENITSRPPARPLDLQQGRSVGENVRVAVDALRNKETGPIRDVVALNAGALLMLSGKAQSLSDGYRLAIETLENGRAFERLLMFIDATHGKREMLDPFLKESR